MTAMRQPLILKRRRAHAGVAARCNSTMHGEDENLVPLINLVFLLIVFFLLAGTISRSDSIAVSPPASSSEDPVRDRRLVVSALADGSLYLNDQPVDQNELADALVRGVAANPMPGRAADMQDDGRPVTPRLVHLRADGALSLGQLKSVLELIDTAGISTTTLLTRLP